MTTATKRFIRPGVELELEIADFDACDPYEIRIDESGELLRLHWKLGGCGDQGDLEFTAAALEKARKFVSFSQGSVSKAGSYEPVTEPLEDHLPPFLLSRGAYRILEKGDGITLHHGGNGDGEVQVAVVEKTVVDVEVAGKKEKVSCLVVAGGDLKLWVVENSEWPLVLKREDCGGDNYCVVVKIR